MAKLRATGVANKDVAKHLRIRQCSEVLREVALVHSAFHVGKKLRNLEGCSDRLQYVDDFLCTKHLDRPFHVVG